MYTGRYRIALIALPLVAFLAVGSVASATPGAVSAMSRPIPASAQSAADATEIVVKYSPTSAYETRAPLLDAAITRGIVKDGQRRPAAPLPASDVTVIVSAAGARTAYTADEHGRLYDAARKQRLELPAPQRLRLAEAVRAARASHYGRLLPWDKVRKLIPKRSTLTITDVETGLAFKAQHRAGARHIDAQPLTAADTAVMKRMYGGSWSWKRRAVTVRYGGHTLAASMHGMPHGGDGIPGNKFAGHFCIHFMGSRTHGSGNIDPEHRMMVYKAAGQLQKLFDADGPQSVVHTFIAAVNMEERQIAAAAFAEADHPQLDFFFRLRRLDLLDTKGPVRLEAPSDLFSSAVTQEIQVRQNGGRSSKLMFTFHLKRTAVYDPWKIELITLVGREQPR